MDLGNLARRAADDASVLEAMQSLDTTQLRVLEAFACLREATVDEIERGLPDPAQDVRAAARRLWSMGLVWGTDELRIVRAAGEAFGPHPCGLAAAGHRDLAPGQVHEAARDVPPDQLGRWVWIDPVVDHPHRLLTARGEVHVLSREASLVLRDGMLLQAAEPRPQLSPAPSRPQGLSMWGPVAGVRYVLLALQREPLPWNPSRGVPRRALADRAEGMAVPMEHLAAWLELGAQAGLIGGRDQRALPTDAAAVWLASGPASMWSALLAAWLDSDRPLAECLPDGRGVLTANGVARYASLKAHILQCWPRDSVVGPDELAATVAWSRPKLHAAALRAGDIHGEVQLLGLVESGVATGAMDALPGDPIAAARTIPAVAQGPSLIVQPDRTIIAPLSIDTPTWRLLDDIATVESWGPVTVHRLDPARQRVSGRVPEEIVQRLRESSRTPLPQAVEYGVRDAQQSGATVRPATVVRCAEDSVERVAAIGFEQVGPRTFTTDLPVGEARERLAGVGICAVDEDPPGTAPALDYPGTAPRGDPAAVRRLAHFLAEPATAPEGVPSELAPADPATIGGVCREAIDRQGSIWLQYTEDGSTKVDLVEPLQLRSGTVSGWSHTCGRTVAVPVSRITAHGPTS